MHQLAALLHERVAAGLKRSTITRCSDWAEAYRVMGKPIPGPWTFEYHPWTREIHDADDEFIIGQKAAQMGFTEAALNKCFHAIDVKGESVLYILPSESDASDFSTSRFDPALELSPHLSKLFSDVKNIGHKRAGSANLFVRGSRSKSKLKSIPVATCILDEVDEMEQANISLAFERMSGQLDQHAFALSTPTIDNFGINKFYRNSTQEHFFFKCPSCSKLTELTFPDCIVIPTDDPTSPEVRKTHLICKECKGIIQHEAKREIFKTGRWVASYSNRLNRGFHVNQLYSTTRHPYQVAELWLKAQTNPTDEQEFYNSKLGMTHVVEGAQITDKMIESSIGTYKMRPAMSGNGLVCMGIDVGKWLHVEITQYFNDNPNIDINIATKARVLKICKLQHFEELDRLMRDFNVVMAVVDKQPETRKAIEFSQRFQGSVKLCHYGHSINSKVIHEHTAEDYMVTVDRTCWLDISLGRFKAEKIILPVDTPQEYKDQIKAPVRIYGKDIYDNPVGKYVSGNDDDHYAHARNYNEIALMLAAGQGVSEFTESPI